MNYSKEIFKMLDVKPNKVFKIKEIPNCLYTIEENLNVKVAEEETKDIWMRALDCLPALLNGTYTIEKIKKPTAAEKIAIDYAKLCGLEWLAKDKNGKVYAYDLKPEKLKTAWESHGHSLLIQFPIDFLSWQDEEPYYIKEMETEGE